MINSLNQNKLDDLKVALEELSKKTLPIETRGVLLTARAQLDQFSSLPPNEMHENRLGALYRVSRSLGTSLDLDEVLNQVMDAIIELTGAERGFLTLIDASTGELKLRAARNIDGENLDSEDMEVSRTVIQTVIDSNEGIVTTDAQNDPRFAGHESVVFHSLKSILCAPLSISGKITGVIYVENRAQSGIFTKEDLDLLDAFAAQSSIAIENAFLYTSTDQALTARLRELETLSQIDRELNEELDLARTLEITRRWAVKGSAAEACWIGLANEDTGQIQISSGPIEGVLNVPGEEVWAAVSDESAIQDISSGSTIFVATPLIHSHELLGAIVVTSTSKFQAQEREYLSRLASRAASAIANARFFQAVRKANESKSQFVSIVSHELRIPLTSIKGYADLIRQGVVGEVNEQQLSFLDVITNNVQRMSRLISDLSDISRIERGKLQLEPTTLQISASVEDALRSMLYKVEENNLTLTTNIPEELPNIHADPNRLVQVLTNLISNACKYTPKGGAIKVNASQKKGFLRVEVIDNGLGISEEDQKKLFTQFFRSEAQEVREQNGWGLGLSVTKKLVELMGGDIGFNSILNQGSTFWFTLPVANE